MAQTSPQTATGFTRVASSTCGRMKSKFLSVPGERSIRDFTPPFTEEDRKLMVQRLPHGETVNKSLFLLRNIMLVLGHEGNRVVVVW